VEGWPNTNKNKDNKSSFSRVENENENRAHDTGKRKFPHKGKVDRRVSVNWNGSDGEGEEVSWGGVEGEFWQSVRQLGIIPTNTHRHTHTHTPRDIHVYT